ncbi:unnamed protein product [uncultured virus]|nr:unnamed protein product [uncultured virus]
MKKIENFSNFFDSWKEDDIRKEEYQLTCHNKVKLSDA